MDRKEYWRQWYLKNKDKIRDRDKKRYEKIKAARLKAKEEYYLAHKEEIDKERELAAKLKHERLLEWQREYREKNREKLNAYRREYFKKYEDKRIAHNKRCMDRYYRLKKEG